MGRGADRKKNRKSRARQSKLRVLRWDRREEGVLGRLNVKQSGQERLH